MAPSTPNPDAIFDALIQNRRDPASLRKRVETLEMLLERSFVHVAHAATLGISNSPVTAAVINACRLSPSSPTCFSNAAPIARDRLSSSSMRAVRSI